MKTLLCLVLLVSAACVPMQPGQGGWGQPAAEPARVAQAGSGGVGCMDVLSCLGNCGDDEACISSCVGSGNPAAQAAVHALYDCTASQCNNDSDCVATTCRPQIDQCTGATSVATAEQPAAEPMANGQPSAHAPILAWLEGQWISPNHQFTFWADGTVRRSSGTPLYHDNGVYSCVSTINETGTVTQQGDLLIMVFPASEGDTCGNHETMPGLTVRYQITWYQYGDEEWKLQLNDIDCTAGAMYCNDRMTRR